MSVHSDTSTKRIYDFLPTHLRALVHHFSRCPIQSQCRIQGEQIIAFDPEHPPGTVRTHRTICTNPDFRIPCVTVFTMPPNLLMAPFMYGIRGKRCIFLLIPLLQKIHSVLTLTEGLQRVFFFIQVLHIAETDS